MPISRLIATACLFSVAALTSVSVTAEDAKRPDKVSFYFAAHEDDWQLFMNPSAFQDVIGGAANILFISRVKTARKLRSASWRMPMPHPGNALRLRYLSTAT